MQGHQRWGLASSTVMPTATSPSAAGGGGGDKGHPIPVKRVTLTSKKNWWLVEMNDEEEGAAAAPGSGRPMTEEVGHREVYNHGVEEHKLAIEQHQQHAQHQQHHHHHYKREGSRPASPIYNPPRHPTSIFSFPTPTAYSAPPNPTASLQPFAHGSASELFRCVVKKPDVIQLEINGEMQSNAADVTVQFLAELRVYTTVARHRNICAFLGCLENVGMVLGYIDGRTLYDVIKEHTPDSSKPEGTVKPFTDAKKLDLHNQLLDGLTHLHSYRLSHGDLSLLNVQVTHRTNTVKLLDFGRSVSADSSFRSPGDEPVDPFGLRLTVEQIHPGTRPFCAPEILREECTDPLLADAYSFGMILVCLDRCESVDVKPWEQRKDRLPADFFAGCTLFASRAAEYLRPVSAGRRRLSKQDMFIT